MFVDVNGRIVEVNQAFETSFGYTSDEALELTVFDIIAPENHDLLIERIQHKSEERYEIVGVTKSGEGRHMEVSGRTIPYHGRRPASSRSMTSPIESLPRSRWGCSRSSTPPT